MAEDKREGAFFVRETAFGFADCNAQKRASLYAVMKLLSEMAGDDYDGRGLGHSAMRQKGYAMLLARLSISFERRPIYAERITARTWERGTTGPYFFRDFELFDSASNAVASAASTWFIADVETREIVRPDKLSMAHRKNDPRKSACADCGRIKPSGQLRFLGERPVYYSDIDGNDHINNAIYGRIAEDFLPQAYRGREIRRFSINFNMETKPDETLEISGSETSEGFLLFGQARDVRRFGCEFEFQAENTEAQYG